MAETARKLREAMGLVRGSWRALTGEDAYERYLQYHREHEHPGEPMGEKEFWRDRCDRQDRDPGGRCC